MPEPMNLLFIAPSLEGRHGWPGRTARPLAAALAANGQAVTLLHTGRAASEENDRGVRIRQFKRRWPEALCRSPDLARFLATPEAACDAVHLYGASLRTLHYAAAKAQRDRVPLIVSPRGTLSQDKPSARGRFLANLLVHPGALARVKGWHVLSRGEEEELKALGLRQPILVAPDGVDTPSPLAIGSAREHWHKLCPACALRPTALFHGALTSRKRILELIDLWLAVAPREWLLLIAGANDEYTRADLRDYVSRVLGGDRVAIESSEGHPAPYAAANLFLMPAVRESLARSTGQALAAGLPVITTDTSPWSGFDQAGAGWRTPWEEFGSVLKAALAEGLGALESRGQSARAWISAQHSWKHSASQLAEFYIRLGARRP